jgi:hypothetical protein
MSSHSSPWISAARTVAKYRHADRHWSLACVGKLDSSAIVETPDKLGGENEYNTLKALGSDVEAYYFVYFCPKENRKLSETKKPGILHLKWAVADVEWLFLSSANLIHQAFTISME